MKQTVVEWLAIEYNRIDNKWKNVGQGQKHCATEKAEALKQAKAMEKNNTDNKVIHFAEWLTNKHTTTLITLYEQFEEQYYNETFKSE